MSLLKRILPLGWTLAGCWLLLANCSINNITDGGTETGNAAVVGMFYSSDGKTPARNAVVHIRKKNTLADTSHMQHSGTFADTATVKTNNDGKFAFGKIDTGTYVVEGNDGNNNLALIDSVKVVSKDSTDTLPPDTLKPAGAIKGIIYLSEGGDPRKVFVLVFGIDRFARVDEDGRFRFQNLAEARYDLRIISSLDDYGVLDTVGVPVLSADTTNLDTVELPFIGIPTPKNVKISYDTLKQNVTLTWSKADTALVKGYNVYRRNVDSNTVLARINTSPITDTVYRDSSGVQDMTYEYKVTALDKQGNEGKLGIGVSVKVVSGYQVVDSLPKGLLSEEDGLVFIAQIATGSKVIVQSYDSQLIMQNTIQLDSVLFQPQGFDIDSSGNLYFVDSHGIFKFSPAGILLDTLDIWSNNENKTIVVYDTAVFLASGVIREYSLGGDSLAAINQMPDFRADGIVVSKDRVFAGGNRNEIRIFDLNLQFVENWKLNFTHDETVWSLAKDEVDNIYALGYHSNPDFYTMLIYNSDKAYTGKIDIGTNAKYFVVSKGNIFLNQGNYVLVLRLRK